MRIRIAILLASANLLSSGAFAQDANYYQQQLNYYLKKSQDDTAESDHYQEMASHGGPNAASYFKQSAAYAGAAAADAAEMKKIGDEMLRSAKRQNQSSQSINLPDMGAIVLDANGGRVTPRAQSDGSSQMPIDSPEQQKSTPSGPRWWEDSGTDKPADDSSSQAAGQQTAVAAQQQMQTLVSQDNAAAVTQISAQADTNEIAQTEATDAELAIDAALVAQDPQAQAEVPQNSEELKQAFLASADDDNIVAPFSDAPTAPTRGNGYNDEAPNSDTSTPSKFYLRTHDSDGVGVRGDNSDQMPDPGALQASNDLINDWAGSSQPSVQQVIQDGFNEVGDFATSVKTTIGNALDEPSVRFFTGLGFGSVPNVSSASNNSSPDGQLLTAIDNISTDASSESLNLLSNTGGSLWSKVKGIYNYNSQRVSQIGTIMGLAKNDFVPDSGQGGPSS